MNRSLRDSVLTGGGVVTGPELRALGFSRQMVYRRRRSGLLIPVLRDVYTLPGTQLGSRGRQRAAVHSGGSGCVLSHRSSLALHGLVRDKLPVHVSRKGGGSRTRGVPVKESSEFGFRVVSHQSRSFPASQITEVGGIRTTTVERALVEFCADAKPAEIGKALSQGERERVLCWETLDEILAAASGRKGVGRLRAELDFWHPAFADAESEPEEDLLRLIRARSLPMPEANVFLDPYKADFLWPKLKLVVELDPYGTHKGRESFHRDRRKSVELEARGYRVIRFTWEDVYKHPERTLRELDRIMRQQAALPVPLSSNRSW
ncbi:MAG: DUF559 domain-containing protein [Solirubrobacterales bacterium]|nr:DUF559 domain-containing protein [Solirubrobacterales bacterium]